MLNRGLVVSCLAVLVSLFSCKQQDEGGSSGADSGLTHGCIQGVFINGLTGERIALPPSDPSTGLHVLIRNQLIGYVPVRPGADAAMEPRLSGEYSLCNIPLDEEFPIVARIEGFLPYESKILIRSTVGSVTGSGDHDIKKPVPNRIANIKLYPLGIQARDFKVNVYQNGAPVVGADVELTANGTGLFDTLTDTNFIFPLSVRQLPQRIATDTSGAAVFSGAGLVIGGVYKYKVAPPEGGISHDVASGEITVGFRLVADDKDQPFEEFVDLGHPGPGLIDVSNSLQFNDYNTSGTVKYIFNRFIEFVPGTPDQITAVLNNASSAVLAENVPGNNASEQVTAVIAKNTLTLTPVFTTAPAVGNEPGLTVTISGIKVRPLGSPGTGSGRSYDPTVSIFGGEAPPVPVPTTLEVSGSDVRTVAINNPVTPAMEVQVLDQFDNPFDSGSVTMTIVTVPMGATGQLLTNGVLTSSTSLSEVVNAQGKVAMGFTAGNTAGNYTVTATYGFLTPVTFTITATP